LLDGEVSGIFATALRIVGKRNILYVKLRRKPEIIASIVDTKSV